MNMLRTIALLWTVGICTAQQCQKFSQIYASGKELCENMWGGAFTYSTDLDNAYTMWFFGENPNDAVSTKLGHDSEEVCHLDYFHKDTPSPEGPGFTECHPWKSNSCCHDATVNTPEKLRDGYGPEFRWDRCGPLSAACERFFVAEGCFYECDPHIGYYRKFPNASHYSDSSHSHGHDGEAHWGTDNEWYNATKDSHNQWQVYKMPIRADFCDAWHTACYDDMFCGASSGDYFECAKLPPDRTPVDVQGPSSEVCDGLINPSDCPAPSPAPTCDGLINPSDCPANTTTPARCLPGDAGGAAAKKEDEEDGVSPAAWASAPWLLLVTFAVAGLAM